MSVSKWAYDPEICDGRFCPGDCDNCPWINELQPILRRTLKRAADNADDTEEAQEIEDGRKWGE